MQNYNSNIVKGNHAEENDLRTFLDGSVRSTVLLRSCAVGLGTYNPGWKWSAHAGAQTGKSSENHIGYILSGNMIVKDSNGIEIEVGSGEAFEVGPGHDAWVIGNEPCIALDFIPIKNC
ncbi:MAG: hypothetical protein JXR46_12100 [Calditrichaceae bacterium]|nr:hypothetical protein [Calditrichaceae bacterium]MBN2709778.1 hypothetical protein [Calditrichaceae bacterium]RQV94972.1 MAG: hypothetical protein EH224_08850 [Calditrichota bacterium]